MFYRPFQRKVYYRRTKFHSIVSDDKLIWKNSVRNTLDFMVDFRNNKVCDNISEVSHLPTALRFR